MIPVLFRIPGINLDVPGYGFVLMLGFLLAVMWAVRRAVRSGANPDIVLNCAFIALLAGVGGARLMYVVHYWDQYQRYGAALDVFKAALDCRKGGLEVYGGFLAATIGTLIYFLVRKHSLRWYLDILAPSAALGMGLGRLGCFLNGCCWGSVCDLPWAVRFPFGSPAAAQHWHAGEPGMDLPKELICVLPGGIGADGRVAHPLLREVLWVKESEIERELAKARPIYDLKAKLAQAQTEAERQAIQDQLRQVRDKAPPIKYADIVDALLTHHLSLGELKALAREHPSQPVHPTQLYSALTLTILALFLNSLYWRRSRDGVVICTLLAIEPWTRFVLEILRADNPTDTFSLTVSQFLSLMLSPIGVIGLLMLRRLPARSPRAQRWEPPPPAVPQTGKARPAAR